jgi:hypothetical protein
MRERERHDDAAAPGAGGDCGHGGNLDRLREEAEDLLTAGDEAIRRALSGDSEAFLRANRQQGGQ